MAESDHQRNVRKTREAAEATAREAARAADWQQEGTLQQARVALAAERAADAQRQANALQAQALEEQRRAVFAMWRQTADGQAFSTWATRALAISDLYERNTTEYELAWKTGRDKATASITPEERAQFTSGSYVGDRPQTPAHWDAPLYLLALLAVAVAILLLITMGVGALFTGGQAPFGFVWPSASLAIAAAFIIWGRLLRRRHPEWRDENAAYLAALDEWKRANAAAREAAARDRVDRLGFDPRSDPNWQPAPWTLDTHPGPIVNTFIARAYTSFPGAEDLPGIEPAIVRDPDTESVGFVREALIQLSSDSRAQ